jgi:serine/threonine protein kinase
LYSLNLKRFPLGRMYYKDFFHQMLVGLEYLHSINIVHRDVKLSNFLISADGVIKLGDFGLGKNFLTESEPHSPTVVTLLYRAPELLLSDKQYSSSIDIWSLGCCLAEFIIGKPFISATTQGDIAHLLRIFSIFGVQQDDEIFQNSTLTFTTKEASNWKVEILHDALETEIEILEGCFLYDKNKRFTATQILEHVYWKEEPQMKRYIYADFQDNPSEKKKSRYLDSDDEENFPCDEVWTGKGGRPLLGKRLQFDSSSDSDVDDDINYEQLHQHQHPQLRQQQQQQQRRQKEGVIELEEELLNLQYSEWNLNTNILVSSNRNSNRRDQQERQERLNKGEENDSEEERRIESLQRQQLEELEYEGQRPRSPQSYFEVHRITRKRKSDSEIEEEKIQREEWEQQIFEQQETKEEQRGSPIDHQNEFTVMRLRPANPDEELILRQQYTEEQRIEDQEYRGEGRGGVHGNRWLVRIPYYPFKEKDDDSEEENEEEVEELHPPQRKLKRQLLEEVENEPPQKRYRK